MSCTGLLILQCTKDTTNGVNVKRQCRQGWACTCVWGGMFFHFHALSVLKTLIRSDLFLLRILRDSLFKSLSSHAHLAHLFWSQLVATLGTVARDSCYAKKLVRSQNLKKETDRTFAPFLLRQGEPGTSQYSHNTELGGWVGINTQYFGWNRHTGSRPYCTVLYWKSLLYSGAPCFTGTRTCAGWGSDYQKGPKAGAE